MKRGILLAILLGIAMAGGVLAQEHPQPQPAKGKALEATVVGENVCLGCTLKKESGAAAQCSKYGHRHALRVITATAGGKELPEMKGWLLHYLDNDKGQPVLKEHHGETLTLRGKVYGAERVFEVEKLEGGEKPSHSEHPKGSEHPR